MNTPTEINYSDGSKVLNPVVQIWDDLHTEARGNWYRAFWCASSSTSVASGSPVIGYCSPGGSQRTIRACAAEVWRLYPDARVFRYGKEILKKVALGS